MKTVYKDVFLYANFYGSKERRVLDALWGRSGAVGPEDIPIMWSARANVA